MSGQSLQAHYLLVKDPLTNKTLVKLRNPKLAIKGYANSGQKCINLNKCMLEKCITPDFGFDIAEIQLFKRKTDPWFYISKLVAPKYKYKSFW